MKRISVARYQKMIEAGILTSEDNVELLEECVVLKDPRTPRHDGTVDLIMAAIPPHLLAGWVYRIGQSIVLSDSQPEPDFAIVRGTPRSYLMRHPVPADVGLIIEVADSSLLRDQRDKTRIYARGGIPCYWIINLVDRRIEVFTQPSGPVAMPAYGAFQTFQPGDAVPLVLDGTTTGSIPATDLLP